MSPSRLHPQSLPSHWFPGKIIGWMKYLIPETLNLICQQIFTDFFKNSPPRMQELLEEEDHDKVEQGRGDNEDWHHPGEGEEEAGGCFFLGEHVPHLYLL